MLRLIHGYSGRIHGGLFLNLGSIEHVTCDSSDLYRFVSYFFGGGEEKGGKGALSCSGFSLSSKLPSRVALFLSPKFVRANASDVWL